jgi:hypothetical protein
VASGTGEQRHVDGMACDQFVGLRGERLGLGLELGGLGLAEQVPDPVEQPTVVVGQIRRRATRPIGTA